MCNSKFKMSSANLLLIFLKLGTMQENQAHSKHYRPLSKATAAATNNAEIRRQPSRQNAHLLMSTVKEIGRRSCHKKCFLDVFFENWQLKPGRPAKMRDCYTSILCIQWRPELKKHLIWEIWMLFFPKRGPFVQWQRSSSCSFYQAPQALLG